MGKKCLWLIPLYIMVVSSFAFGQVTPGTTNSKTLDGVGNKITSQAGLGANRPLHVYCLGGTCGGAGGVSDINVAQILGVAPSATNPLPNRLSTGVAYYDARDRNWTLAFGTDSVTVNSITNPVAVTGTFFQATQPVSGNLGRTWTLSSGTDSVAAIQSGTWNINSLTSITNPVAITNANLDAALSTLLTTTAFQARINTLGQKTMANSTPFVIASDQTSIPVAATVSNLFLLEATFTSRINTLGQKTMAASTPVVLPSDQSAIPVTVLSTVGAANEDGACPSGAASFTVVASNASRTWLAMWASPGNTDDVYVKLGTTATTSDARIAPGQSINFTSGRIYTGRVDAVPASGTQAVCLMELN